MGPGEAMSLDDNDTMSPQHATDTYKVLVRLCALDSDNLAERGKTNSEKVCELVAAHPQFLQSALEAAVRVDPELAIANKKTIRKLVNLGACIDNVISQAASHVTKEFLQELSPQDLQSPLLSVPQVVPIYVVPAPGTPAFRIGQKRSMDPHAPPPHPHVLPLSTPLPSRQHQQHLSIGSKFPALRELMSREEYIPYQLTEFKAVRTLTDENQKQAVRYATLVEDEIVKPNFSGSVCLDSLALINFGLPSDKLAAQWFAKRTVRCSISNRAEARPRG